MTVPAHRPASQALHYEPCLLSALDRTAGRRLLSASAYLYRQRHVLRTANTLFHQGRTLGLLDGDALSSPNRVACHPCGRFLVQTRRDEVGSVARSLEQAGLRVDAGLVTVAADVGSCRRRIAALAGGTPQPLHAVAMLRLDADEELVRQVQALQARRGLIPMPAWFLRGDAVASATLAWLDGDGKVFAAGVVQLLPSLGKRWRRPALASGLCVRDRGRGWGRHLNAALLSLAIGRFDADGLIEIVEHDNHASLRINAAAGLSRDPEIAFLYAEPTNEPEHAPIRLDELLVGPAGLEPAT